jgi:sodium/bile acid cotransporter 7
VAALGLLAALTGACGAPPDGTSDEAKLERIREMYAGYSEKFDNVESISVEEYLALFDGDEPPVLVDVRSPEEQAVSMIPGAITRDQFERRQGELEGRVVVAYCTIGYRSGLFAEVLSAYDWDARNLEGSILAWTHSGRDLEVDGQPVRRLHVYGSRWDLAASGYETVW